MASNSSTDVIVSFIIPHHGRDTLLLETVASISRQVIDGAIELIIISKDPGSAFGELRDKLNEIFNRGNVEFIPIVDGKTISYGRNFGAERASGRYLAFIDADVRLAPDWVSVMINALRDHSECLLSGAVQQPDTDKTDVDVIKSSMSQANAGRVNALPGNALFIEKRVFEQHPKFPEHLETCEDWVFTNTLALAGGVVLSNDSHFVHLGEDKNYRTLFKKEIWRGTSNLGSIKGRKIELAEWPSFIVPMVVGGSFLLAICLVLFGALIPGVALLLFALVAPALYAIRLKRKSSVPVTTPVLIYFYLVYFLARAIGMVKGVFSGATFQERLKTTHE